MTKIHKNFKVLFVPILHYLGRHNRLVTVGILIMNQNVVDT